jgi:hypothetical protein
MGSAAIIRYQKARIAALEETADTLKDENIAKVSFNNMKVENMNLKCLFILLVSICLV